MIIKPQSTIALAELAIRPDRGAYIVEDVAARQFYEMAEVSVAAIRLLEQGSTLEEAEAILKTRFPGEDIHMLDFAEQLLELELATAIDGVPFEPREARAGANADDGQRGQFLWISSSVARMLFNPATMVGFAAILILNVWLVAANPILFPRYGDLFVSRSMALNSVTWLAVSLVFITLHELAHVMAVRAYGLPAKLGIGRRFILVVFETEMDAIWRLPPKQRYIPYLAGMGMDQAVLLVCLLAQLWMPAEALWADRLAALAVLDLFVKLIFQCCFFMKTDLYYVVENATGCYNLMERSRQWLASMRYRSDEGTTSRTQEPIAVRLYGLFYAAGLLFMLGMAGFYFIPQLWTALTSVLPNLAKPGEPLFWDAVLFILEIMLMGGLLFRSWRKEKGD